MNDGHSKNQLFEWRWTQQFRENENSSDCLFWTQFPIIISKRLSLFISTIASDNMNKVLLLGRSTASIKAPPSSLFRSNYLFWPEEFPVTISSFPSLLISEMSKVLSGRSSVSLKITFTSTGMKCSFFSLVVLLLLVIAHLIFIVGSVCGTYSLFIDS